MSGDRNDDSTRGQTPFERYVMHVVQAISIAAILGVIALLWDMRQVMSDQERELAVANAQLVQVNERIEDFRAFMADRYTASQADRDLTPIRRELSDHEARIRALEADGRRPPR